MGEKSFSQLTVKTLAGAVAALLALTGCEKKKEEPVASGEPVWDVYVASGTTYGGLGVTMAAPAQTIARYDSHGNFRAVLRDYTSSAGDTPVSILDYDPQNIIALVENTASRRVELIKKDGTGYTTLFTGAGLSAVLRSMRYDENGALLIARSSATEKYTVNGVRVTMGAAAFVNAPAGACATATSNMNGVAVGPEGQILISHAFTAASTNNKVMMISKTGYASAADCVAVVTPPTTAYFPTSLLMHSSGHLLIGYGNNTGAIHQIYSVPVNSNTFGTPVKAFEDISVLQGISNIAELPDGDILVASAAAAFNTIERFSFDPQTGTLTRKGSRPTFLPSIFTRSISSVLVVDPAAVYPASE